MFHTIQSLYQRGILNAAGVQNAVKLGFISQEEYQEITGEGK